ncbi:MAG: macro domain-containing protein [Chloroflexota bacterium]
MITYVHGDLFYSPARVLVNPVNTVGTMGSGTAHDFKRFFPAMYKQYRDLCQRDEFAVGQLMLYRTPHKWILNFPTKRHFRAEASLDHIEAGLKKFVRIYAEQGITSISFPALGTTNEDELAWDDVNPLMESYLDPLPISVFVHIHTEKTADQRRNTRAMKNWLTGLPRTVTFEEFWEELFAVVRGTTKKSLRLPFQAVATEAKGRQRVSLKITPRDGNTIFLPETQLRDLWHYSRRAGYIMPHNLPAGLEEHAGYIMTLLSQLSWLRPLQMERQDGTVVTGLQYVPPIDRKNDTIEVSALMDSELS